MDRANFDVSASSLPSQHAHVLLRIPIEMHNAFQKKDMSIGRYMLGAYTTAGA